MPLHLTAALADTVGVTDLLSVRWKTGGLTRYRLQFAETVGITATVKTRIVNRRSFPETVGITATRTTSKGSRRPLTDTVGITDSMHPNTFFFPNTVGITDFLAVKFVPISQYDTWRPVPKPGNERFLACRTPHGDHDTTLTNIMLWTFNPDGTGAHLAFGAPASNGWLTYQHPEWLPPTGVSVIVAAETSTQYQLVLVDASGF